MKTTAFADRAKQLAAWFQEWNQCEQTIVLYSLLTKVSATQARFFSLVLEHVLKNGQDSQELARMETDANNPVFLSGIHSEQDSVALSRLLSHILLLHPGNDKAREEYLKLLPKVLFGSAEDPEYLYQCRQLLSLALVHPAFPHEDREKLTFWLSRLGDKCKNIAGRNGGNTMGPQTRSATLPTSQNHTYHSPPPRRIYQLNTGSLDEPGRTNGANRIYITLPHNTTLPFADSFDALDEIDTHPLFEDDDEIIQKGFTLSSTNSLMNHGYPSQLPTEHCSTPNSYDEYMKRMKHIKSASLPPNRSPSACSLPAMLDDNTFWKQGMKDVPIWLKSLRLHKYQDLFVDMTYESLLNMTGEFLDTKNITRGARNKILISVKKLRQRADRLTEIEQDIEKPGELLSCINRIKQMLITPIKAYTLPEDQPTSTTATPSTASTTTAATNESEPTDTITTNNVKQLESSVPSTVVSTNLSESPQHASSGGSSCSTPPSSPRLHRSSSMSSVDDLLAKEFPESDLPSLITKVTGKVFSQLMMHTETNEENLSAFIKLLDSVMCHEAFKVSHKKLFFEWKQQCQQTLRVISPKKSPRNRGWPSAFTIAGNPPHPKVPYPTDRKVSRRNTSRGGTMGHKVPTTINSSSPRSSSTLPRANPSRQFQPPLPPPYYPPHRNRSNSGSSMTPPQAPIPIPAVLRAHRYVNLTMPRHQDQSDYQMDELCKSVTEHALEEQIEF